MDETAKARLAQRIATYLNQQGYRARTGKMWHHATIRGIVCNLTYTGVLRCGESFPICSLFSPAEALVSDDRMTDSMEDKITGSVLHS